MHTLHTNWGEVFAGTKINLLINQKAELTLRFLLAFFQARATIYVLIFCINFRQISCW